MSDVERLVAEIPAHLKERVDVDEKTNKAVVTEALRVYYGVADGDGLQALRHRHEQERERLERLQDREEELKERKKEAREKVERLQSQLQEFTANLDDYEAELEDVVAWAKEGKTRNIVDDLKMVREIAGRHDKTPETVVNDIKDRSDLPEEKFIRGRVKR